MSKAEAKQTEGRAGPRGPRRNLSTETTRHSRGRTPQQGAGARRPDNAPLPTRPWRVFSPLDRVFDPF